MGPTGGRFYGYQGFLAAVGSWGRYSCHTCGKFLDFSQIQTIDGWFFCGYCAALHGRTCRKCRWERLFAE